jgi:hypothetical protein
LRARPAGDLDERFAFVCGRHSDDFHNKLLKNPLYARG